jgi:sugar lactone lactonase YvrE
MMMNVRFCAGLVSTLFIRQAFPSDFRIDSWDRQGNISWTNAFPSGVCTVEATTLLTNPRTSPWRVQQNYFTTNAAGRGVLGLSASNHFFRLLAADVSANNPSGYTNLLESFGLLRTIAGNGYGGVDGSNYWHPSFEGGYATNAALSRPHFAMADTAGNVFIVDKGSHSVLKVTPDSRVHTVAGTHFAGNGPDYSTNATRVQLNAPNGIWVRGDGTVYVLDTGNSKIRRLDTNGMMATLFSVTNGVISQGRGIWVKEDESLAYFASGKEIKKWTPAGGVATLNNNFNELGNFVMDPNGDIIATDRGANKVYFLDATGGNAGSRNILFGNGSTNAVADGTLAITNSLYGVRGVWLVPTGGYLLATHEGSQVLYVDPAGVVHVFVNGAGGNVHSGDGQWFHSPGNKVSEVRAVSIDSKGNILITENDFGYVRRIDFTRLSP